MKRVRRRKKLKLKTKIVIIILLIISLTYFFVQKYLEVLNPKIIEVANQKITKTFKYYLSTDISYDLLKKITLEDLIIIRKNNNGEILTVDFDLEKSYKVLDEITNVLNDKIYNLEQGKVAMKDHDIVYSENGLIIKFPLFLASSYALISNLGPEVYLKINFIETILTNIKTKVTNYGLNNALLEIYVTVELNQELISPVVKDNFKINYDILIASKIINGRVPEFYENGIVNDNLLKEN